MVGCSPRVRCLCSLAETVNHQPTENSKRIKSNKNQTRDIVSAVRQSLKKKKKKKENVMKNRQNFFGVVFRLCSQRSLGDFFFLRHFRLFLAQISRRIDTRTSLVSRARISFGLLPIVGRDVYIYIYINNSFH